MTNPVTFAVVGGGWRAEFYLRIAQALPERFRVGAVLVRDTAKGAVLAKRFAVPVVQTLPALAATHPAFVATSVGWGANPELLRELAALNLPTLSETPPAPDLPSLLALWSDLKNAPLQIAEQYPFQPLHAARLSVAAGGKIGAIRHAQVSAAHGYHGMALLRAYLQIGLEDATIRAVKVPETVAVSPGRNGDPTADGTESHNQLIAWLAFSGGAFGVFDFSGSQYFSWVRGNRVLVRGERGEIENDILRYLADVQTPIETRFMRRDTGQNGNLEGAYHAGITAGDTWAYRNPFVPARLSDDEIALATCLRRMAEYAGGGDGFYGIAEGCHDHYLGICADRAAASGDAVRTERQPWTQ